MRIDAEGGASRVVSDSAENYGMAWGATGAILVVDLGFIRRIDGGGEFSTTLEEGEGAHWRPHFLPDGKHFLFYVEHSDPDKRGIYLTALDSNEKTLVRSAESDAQYVAPGYILFVDGQTLMAQRFAPSSGKLEGQPVALAHDVHSGLLGHGAFSASRNVLVYNLGSQDVHLEWFDRDGKSLGSVGEPAPYRSVVLSPDGRRAIAGAIAGANLSLWILDLERGGIAAPLMPGGTAADPVWSPDGREVVMSAPSSNGWDLFPAFARRCVDAGAGSVLRGEPVGRSMARIRQSTRLSRRVHDQPLPNGRGARASSAGAARGSPRQSPPIS